MPIVISNEEKNAIQDYFEHPERYISEEWMHSLGGQLPDGTKISREKVREHDSGQSRTLRYYQSHVSRCYIITDPQDGITVHQVPIQCLYPNDPGTHSATLLSGEIYFHQNKDDLPWKLPDDFEDRCDPPEDEEEAKSEAYLQYKEAWAKSLGKPDYVLNRSKLEQGAIERTVKYAVNMHGERFYLKRDCLFGEADTTFSWPVEAHESKLRVGPSIFRKTTISTTSVGVKKTTISRDAGEVLDAFIEKRQPLTNVQKEKIVKALLTQYLCQIYDEGLVHTDIKSSNICIKENTSSEETPFIITFIDFDESFNIQEPRETGCGTVGYMAPEFFNTYEDYIRQIDNREISEEAYVSTLRSDHKKQFSVSSDVFALARVCLIYNLLSVDSQLSIVVQNMLKKAPEDRPTGNVLREALGLVYTPEQTTHSTVSL